MFRDFNAKSISGSEAIIVALFRWFVETHPEFAQEIDRKIVSLDDEAFNVIKLNKPLARVPHELGDHFLEMFPEVESRFVQTVESDPTANHLFALAKNKINWIDSVIHGIVRYWIGRYIKNHSHYERFSRSMLENKPALQKVVDIMKS